MGHTMRGMLSVLALVLVCVLSLAIGPAMAVPAATTYYVGSVTDGSNTTGCTSPTNTTCTLQGAVSLITTGDTVTFGVNFPQGGVVNVNAGGSLPHLTVDMTLDGGGRGPKLDGQGLNVFYVNSGTITIIGVTIQNGGGSNGGGLLNYLPGGTVTVMNSTFTGNNVGNGEGGAIWNAYGSLTVVNSTFIGNSAGFGSAIFFDDGTVMGSSITNSTIAANPTLGPDYAVSYSNFSSANKPIAKNSLIVNNSGAGDTTAITLDSTDITGSFTFADSTTGTLADNGGPTQTAAIGTSGPAYQAGNLTTCQGESVTGIDGMAHNVDQRGAPRVVGGKCSIGAYEPGGIATQATLTANPTHSAAGQPVTLTATVSGIIGGGPNDGSVAFRDGGTAISCTNMNAGTVTNGNATCTTTSLTAAGSPHSLTASYAPGANYAASPTSAPVSFTVYPAITFTAASPLPDGIHGTAYSQMFSASGGAGGPFTYAIANVMDPASTGLMASSGSGSNGPVSVTGTPGHAGTFSFTVQATDSQGNVGAATSYTLTVDTTITAITRVDHDNTTAPTVTFNLTLADDVSGLSTANFAPIVTGSVTGGSVMSVMTSGSNHQYSVVVGGYTVTGSGGTLALQYANNTGVSPLVIPVPYIDSTNGLYHLLPPITFTTTSPLPAAAVNASYSHGVSASGGTSMGFTYALKSGDTVPAGLTLSANGTITGMPTTATMTPASFTIIATDSATNTGSMVYQLTVDSAITFTAASPLPDGVHGTAYSQMFSASGGAGGPFTYAITNIMDPANTGLMATSGSGQVNVMGTPGHAGTFSFTVQATDSQGNVGAATSYTLTVDTTVTAVTRFDHNNITAPSVTFTVTFADDVTGLTTTNFAPVVTGSVSGAMVTSVMTNGSNHQYHVVVGGYTVTGSGGTLALQYANNTGVSPPAANAPYTDMNNGPYTLLVPIAFTTASPLPAAAVNASYSHGVVASGGTGTGFTYALNSGDALPAGLTLNANGTITGMPTTATMTPASFTIIATDSATNTGSMAYQLTVDPAITFTTASPLPDGVHGIAYSQMFSASGGAGGPFAYAITNVMDPNSTGLMTSSGNGGNGPVSVTGTPAHAGAFSFTVQATDSQGNVGAATSYTLTVETTLLSLTRVGPALTNASSVTYTATFADALSGLSGTNFTITTALTGTSVGTPTTSDSGVTWSIPVSTGMGDGDLTLVFANNTGLAIPVHNTGFMGDTVTIDKTAPTLATMPSTLPAATFGQAYGPVSFTASDAHTPVITGATGVPASFTFTPGTGAMANTATLSGTPTSASAIMFTVQVQDAAGNSVNQPYTITVNKVTPTVSVASSSGAVNPTSVFGTSVTFTATITGVNGTAPTGSVSFTSSDGTMLMSGMLTSGAGAASTATVSTGALKVGMDTLTATYVPGADPNYAAGMAATVMQSVTKATPTVHVASSSAMNKSSVAERVTFTATLTGVNGTAPMGMVTFTSSDGTMLMSGTLTSGAGATSTATVSTIMLKAGTDTITATYSGDGTYLAGMPATVMQTVIVTPANVQPMTHATATATAPAPPLPQPSRAPTQAASSTPSATAMPQPARH